MATKTMKKTISGILAAVLTTASLISLLPAAFADGESTTEYNISQDLDAKGKWKYRNLIPSEGNEDSDSGEGYVEYKNSSNVYTPIEKDTTDKKEGQYSWKAVLSKSRRIKVYFDSTYDLTGKYYMSTWIKHSYSSQMNFTVIPTYRVTGNNSAVEPNMIPQSDTNRSSVNVPKTDDWSYYTETFAFPAANQTATIYTTNTNFPAIGFNHNTDNAEDITVHIDDWNFRLIPGWKVNATGVSAANGVAEWTFDRDIDKWTVTKDLFTVTDGVTINTVTVETNETSRKTTLTVSYSSNSAVGSITLPTGIKDAWGRAITDIDTYKTADVSTVETTYDSTATSELDAWGKWKYRNLLPSEGEENTSKDAVGGIFGPDKADVTKDTDNAHSGSYSWSTDVKKGKGMTARVDGITEAGTYYYAVWLKAKDKSGNSTTDTTTVDHLKNYPFHLILNWHHNEISGYANAATNTEEEITTSNMLAKENWQYFQCTTKDLSTLAGEKETLISNTEKGAAVRLGSNMWIDQEDFEMTMYADDWSFRLIPEWKVYFKEKVSVPGENKIRWTFDKDIDPWTCTKDLFTTEGCTVTDVSVVTEEKTRVTTLTVTYNVTGANASITLPEGLTDAWGREIQDVETNKTFRLTELTEFDSAGGEFVKVIGADVPADALVFVASYDSDENLLGVKAVTVTGGVARGTAVSASTANSVKLFVWTKDLQPICESLGLK